MAYAVLLVLVATTLLALGPRVQDRVVSHLSTNLHNLAHGIWARYSAAPSSPPTVRSTSGCRDRPAGSAEPDTAIVVRKTAGGPQRVRQLNQSPFIRRQ